MMPRSFRKRIYEEKFRHIIHGSPLIDINQAKAAKEAIEQKLDEDDARDRHHFQKQVDNLKKQL